MPYTEKAPFISGTLNADRYSTSRVKIEDFFESERYFFDKVIKPGISILDIGCAAGGLGHAVMTSVEKNIQYWGIDPDKRAIDYGRRHFPDLNFIEGWFPDDLPAGMKFDLVIMTSVFNQTPKWKELLFDLVNASKKYVLIAACTKLEGQAIVDKDISYFYYLDSGERTFQVIHNLYHLINFCCIHEIGAKKITYYGYKGKPGNNYRDVPASRQVHGHLLLELLPEKENKNIKRVGGIPDDEAKKRNISIFKPEIEVIIDRKPFDMT